MFDESECPSEAVAEAVDVAEAPSPARQNLARLLDSRSAAEAEMGRKAQPCKTAR
jgi:hypothetical protein